MRKLQEIDYERIEKGLKNIDEAFKDLNIKDFDKKINFEDYFNLYYNGYNGSRKTYSYYI